MAATLQRELDELPSPVGPVWMDFVLTGGQVWWDVILDRIRQCHLFVFAVSQYSTFSANCGSQLEYACTLDRVILAVRLDDSLPGDELPELRHVQSIDYRPNDETSTMVLARALRGSRDPRPCPRRCRRHHRCRTTTGT